MAAGYPFLIPEITALQHHPVLPVTHMKNQYLTHVRLRCLTPTYPSLKNLVIPNSNR
jgi:hypothetical protein